MVASAVGLLAAQAAVVLDLALAAKPVHVTLGGCRGLRRAGDRRADGRRHGLDREARGRPAVSAVCLSPEARAR